MRSLMTALALAVVVWLPGRLSAQEEARSLAERVQDLQLTEQQESQISDIRKECRPKVQEAAKELRDAIREEVTKIGAVLTPEQKEKLKNLREERKERRAAGLAERIAHLEELHLSDAEMAKIAEIRKEYRPRVRKALESLKGTLTREQWKARAEGVKAGKKRGEILASFKLNDDQKAKVAAVCKEVKGLVHEEMEKIRDVLTEAQKEKLQEFKEERRERVRDRMAHRIANFKELNLTEEQKTEIRKIRQEYRPKVHEAGNKLRALVREEMEKIVAVVKG